MRNDMYDERYKKNYTVVLPLELIDEIKRTSYTTGIRITTIAENAFTEYLQKLNDAVKNKKLR